MPWRWVLVTFLWGISCASMAQDDEKVRLKGFAEHHQVNKNLEKDRLKGLKEHTSEILLWDKEREDAKSMSKRERSSAVMSEDSPEAKADTKEKEAYLKDLEAVRRDYVSKKTKQDLFDRKALHLPSEEEELGLTSDRPRVDYKKRVIYGGRPNYSTMPMGQNGGLTRPSFGGGRFSGEGDSFPPPPNMDEDPYVPAPTFDGEEDIEPPPPPPFPEDMEYSGPEGGDDFIPPPPPPPPGFGDTEIEPIENEF